MPATQRIKPHMRELIGIAEATRLSGLGSTRLRWLADMGEIPMVRDPVGRRLLDRAAIRRLAQKQKARPSAKSRAKIHQSPEATTPANDTQKRTDRNA